MMLYKFGFFISGLVFFVSCGSNTVANKPEVVKKDTVKPAELSKCEALFKEATDADNVLLRANTVSVDDAARATIAFYNFSNICKGDSLAPVFLLKAGQVAQSVGNFTQAQAFFVKCKDEFPDFNNRGAVLFLLAQLYDEPSKLNNEEEASTLYRQIMREYPNSSFAADAKAAVKNLGKTDEELVKEFLKKNK